MQTKVEGLLLNKTNFQDRHLICSLLLRSGKKVSVMFYGGQGGGKKMKPTQLELGSMLDVELSVSKPSSEVYRAKEWKPIWKAEKMRGNHRAFTLTCLISEIAAKIVGEEDLHQSDLTDEHEGIFRVVSNALFHLDKSIEDGVFDSNKELTVFLGKLLGEQGLFPQRENCCLCDAELTPKNISLLNNEHGGFTCQQCAPGGGESAVSLELWRVLGPIGSQKYPELVGLEVSEKGVSKRIMDYFLYQFQLDSGSLKSLSMVFQL